MNSNIAKERISYVMRPDSITTSQGDFLATHVAIEKLHILDSFDIMPSGGRNYSEEVIYKRFVLNPENRHQFIAVYGQSGTGKSHIIRWFETKFQYDKPENEVVLFIRRSDNTLKGTIRQLLTMPEVQNIKNRDLFQRLTKATVYEDENKLKGRIYHDFINEVQNDNDNHDITLNNVKKKRLAAFLSNDMVQTCLMSTNGPIDRIYSKVAENTLVDRDLVAEFVAEDFFVSVDFYDAICQAGVDKKAEKLALELMADDTGLEEAEKIAAYLNQFINDVIQRCAGIEAGDFRDVFLDIRKELYKIGENLTLFIEDITSFTGVDEALLDALIVEHTGMNAGEKLCRISSIVGTTSNYLQNNFRDNHKDRITQYIYIPSDAFDEKRLFEFVGRYLNTMSLSEDSIQMWLGNHALASDYPVHNVREGSNWEFVSTDYGKELCLYPFTRNSIRYLYKNKLTQGHQTPRYIIKDIIEPIVNDILWNKENFPSIKYNIINVNTSLSYRIHNQIKDNAQADRLLRFLSIWGDGTPNQFTKDNVLYISSVKKEIIEELGLPVLSMSEVEAPKYEASNNNSADENNKSNTLSDLTDLVKIQEKVAKANNILSEWVNGQKIDVSANVGPGGILRAAQGDICDFLTSSINWQAEGISSDNINKINKSNVKLVTFENQTKLSNPGFYVMPANWKSRNVISAFIHWREYGSQSWKYPESDIDAYLITSWLSEIKKPLIKAVNEFDNTENSYIEAAVAAEIYRIILCGEFKEKNLKNLSAKHLLGNSTIQLDETFHCKEWKSLISLMKQKDADVTNKETIKQYFNITQGSGVSIVVLNEPRLSQVMRKVKANKLYFSEEFLDTQDPVKPRRDTYIYLKNIVDRVDSVAKAELAAGVENLEKIYDSFESREIMEEDILDLTDKVRTFYKEINETQFNVSSYSSDIVKKKAKQISKAISVIEEISNEEDPLKILMSFSGDPISELQPLLGLLKKLEDDFHKVDKQLNSRENKLKDVDLVNNDGSQYNVEMNAVDECISMFGREIEL